MSDEKSQMNDQPANSNGETQTAWAKSCQEMIEQMMAHCSCHPEQMSAMWARCCGAPPKKQEKDRAL